MAKTVQITWNSSKKPAPMDKPVLVAVGYSPSRAHIVASGFFEDGGWYYSSGEKIGLFVVAWAILPKVPSAEDLAA